MTDNIEIVKREVALARMVIGETQGFDKDMQLEIYRTVVKWCISNRISAERGGVNSSHDKANGNNLDNSPTPAQLKYAESLKIDNPGQYTKKELSKRIEDKKNGG